MGAAVRCRSEQPNSRTYSSRSVRNALSALVSSAPTRTAPASAADARCGGTAGTGTGVPPGATGGATATRTGATCGSTDDLLPAPDHPVRLLGSRPDPVLP
jgi:hypothetical protein